MCACVSVDTCISVLAEARRGQLGPLELDFSYKNHMESIGHFMKHGHFKNKNSSNPETQDLVPFTCTLFNFFHQHFRVFSLQLFNLLD